MVTNIANSDRVTKIASAETLSQKYTFPKYKNKN